MARRATASPSAARTCNTAAPGIPPRSFSQPPVSKASYCPCAGLGRRVGPASTQSQHCRHDETVIGHMRIGSAGNGRIKSRRRGRHPRRGQGGVPCSLECARVAEPIAGTRACSRPWPSADVPPWNTTLTSTLWPPCGRVDLMEQIRLSQEMLEQSQELLRQIDEQLAKYPLKP